MGFLKEINSWGTFWKYSFYALAALTAFDLVLWFFKQQDALFLTLFYLLPLWALWVWFNPHLDGKRRENSEGGEESSNTQ